MFRRTIAALTKKWGSPAAKQRVWDAEYKTGKWQYDRAGQNNEGAEPIYQFLEKYGAGGAILDLGCGSGMTVLEMNNSFKSYVGVDVSEVAIENARMALSKETDRAGKVRFFVSDISTFAPDCKFSVILYRESIYYVPQPQIKAMLARDCAALSAGGAIIVRLCDRDRYKGIVKLLEEGLLIVERHLQDDSAMTILVCTPPQRNA